MSKYLARFGACAKCRHEQRGRELVGVERAASIRAFIESIEGTTMWERANPQADFSKAPIARRRTVRDEEHRARRRSVWDK